MSDSFLIVTETGIELNVRIAGQSTLEISEPAAGCSSNWEVRIPDREVDYAGKIKLCPDKCVRKNNPKHSVSASKLANEIFEQFFGMMSLMSSEFKTFVQNNTPADLQKAA